MTKAAKLDKFIRKRRNLEAATDEQQETVTLNGDVMTRTQAQFHLKKMSSTERVMELTADRALQVMNRLDELKEQDQAAGKALYQEYRETLATETWAEGQETPACIEADWWHSRYINEIYNRKRVQNYWESLNSSEST